MTQKSTDHQEYYDVETPTRKQIKRWQQYLADERAEAAVYREIARKKTGEEKEILLSLADAESRHEEYWRSKLGNEVGFPKSPSLGTRLFAFLAKRFGSVFALALIQSAESRSPYAQDSDASEQLNADERIHAEVVRGLAQRGREKMSGNFRAAIFGVNDGLVSNLALVLGVMGTGASAQFVLITGVSGLLSGALSMAAGEYVSVKSQAEFIEASIPNPETAALLPELDMKANELELVYRARGMSREKAAQQAALAFNRLRNNTGDAHLLAESPEKVELGGTALSAALSSFCFFALGALIPILPFIFGLIGLTGGAVSLALVGTALLITGGITGILSGKPPLVRALRQLLIGFGAAAITFALGTAFGTVIG